jgi:hypothetical protein
MSELLIDLFYPHGHNGSMQFLSLPVVYGLFLLLFAGCTSYHRANKAPTEASSAKTAPKLVESPPEPPKVVKGAVWELLSGEQVTLQMKNLDNGKNLTVIIEKGISHRSVTPGHWELTGFEENGTSYVSMNTSKKFVFRRKEKTNVYAGSIVIGCPKIAATDFKLLKQMKFFNRYPFSSTSGLCEVVVGNDFAWVKSQFKKVQKNKKLNLILGF